MKLLNRYSIHFLSVNVAKPLDVLQAQKCKFPSHPLGVGTQNLARVIMFVVPAKACKALPGGGKLFKTNLREQ